jgi:hypothetical protein
VLESIYYDGRRHGFTFEKYAARMYNAYEELESIGEEISERVKVNKLLRGSRATWLENPKIQVRSNPTQYPTLTDASNYLGAMDTELRPTRVGDRLQASANTNNRNIGGGRGGGGRNNNGGRGRGGRGRGRSGWLPREQWLAMSEDERRAHLEGRRNRTQRNVSAASTDNNNSNENENNDNNDQDQNNSTSSGTAGSNFGRGRRG